MHMVAEGIERGGICLRIVAETTGGVKPLDR
jgi:hypothetical protein